MGEERRWARASATVAVVALVALTGCLATPGASSSGTATGTATGAGPPAALDSRLAGLVAADNRSAYAADSGLDYESNRTVGTAVVTGRPDGDGSVRAVVVLDANATLPEGYDFHVVASADGLVEVRVAIDDLCALAREDGVQFVRPPRTPAAAGTGGTVPS